MKNYMENAWKKANTESELKIISSGTGYNIAIENAAILYRKFNNEADAFGSTDRKFTVLVPDRSVEKLKEFGWPVKEIETKDEENPIIYGIKVKVNMDSKLPPSVDLITEFETREGKTCKSSVPLNSNTIQLLDSIVIKNVDMVINVWYNAKTQIKGRSPYSFFLKRMWVTQEPEFNFGGKYDNADRNPEVAEELEDNIIHCYEDED